MKNSFALLGTGEDVDADYNTVEGKQKRGNGQLTQTSRLRRSSTRKNPNPRWSGT